MNTYQLLQDRIRLQRSDRFPRFFSFTCKSHDALHPTKHLHRAPSKRRSKIFLVRNERNRRTDHFCTVSPESTGTNTSRFGNRRFRRSIGTRIRVRGNSSSIDWKHHRGLICAANLDDERRVNKQKLPTLDCRLETRAFVAKWHATRNRVYVYDRRSCRYWHVTSTSHSILNRRQKFSTIVKNCT